MVNHRNARRDLEALGLTPREALWQILFHVNRNGNNKVYKMSSQGKSGQGLSPDRRDRYIVERLRSSPGPVSGELLAAELDMSRVALWKRIESLKAWGYGVEASRKGYVLAHDDGLAGWELEAPGPLVLFDTVTSTMDEAEALARAGAPSGATVLALGQSAGRGRLKDTWESPAGGLYLSVVLRSNLPPSHAGALVLETAAATLRALKAAGATGLGYNWPGDIVADGGLGPRKVGGVLVETHGDIAAADWYIVGLGLNVAPFTLPGRDGETDPHGEREGRRPAQGATREETQEETREETQRETQRATQRETRRETQRETRRATLAAGIVRSLVAWAATPDLDPARWSGLMPFGLMPPGPEPAGKRAIDIALWNGKKTSLVPGGFNARGDLVSADGGRSLSIGECRSIITEDYI